MLLPKDRVGYLDNALEHRAKASKQPLKGALGAFHYKVVIRKRFLAYLGPLVPTSVVQVLVKIRPPTASKYLSSVMVPVVNGPLDSGRMVPQKGYAKYIRARAI